MATEQGHAAEAPYRRSADPGRSAAPRIRPTKRLWVSLVANQGIRARSHRGRQMPRVRVEGGFPSARSRPPPLLSRRQPHRGPRQLRHCGRTQSAGPGHPPTSATARPASAVSAEELPSGLLAQAIQREAAGAVPSFPRGLRHRTGSVRHGFAEDRTRNRGRAVTVAAAPSSAGFVRRRGQPASARSFAPFPGPRGFIPGGWLRWRASPILWVSAPGHPCPWRHRSRPGAPEQGGQADGRLASLAGRSSPQSLCAFPGLPFMPQRFR